MADVAGTKKSLLAKTRVLARIPACGDMDHYLPLGSGTPERGRKAEAAHLVSSQTVRADDRLLSDNVSWLIDPNITSNTCLSDGRASLNSYIRVCTPQGLFVNSVHEHLGR